MDQRREDSASGDMLSNGPVEGRGSREGASEGCLSREGPLEGPVLLLSVVRAQLSQTQGSPS